MSVLRYVQVGDVYRALKTTSFMTKGELLAVLKCNTGNMKTSALFKTSKKNIGHHSIKGPGTVWVALNIEPVIPTEDDPEYKERVLLSLITRIEHDSKPRQKEA